MTTNNSINVSTGASTTMLQGAGVGTAPTFSTTTWPATSTVSQLLYSSATNTISGLATANSSILVTNGSGVPSLSTTVPAHTVTSDLVVSSSGNETTTLTISSPSNAAGANIKLIGNGGVTPNKFLRSTSGSFDIVNSAYNAAIFTLNDAGIISASTWQGVSVATGYGGTGLSSAGTSGNVLTSNGSVWTSAAPGAGSAFSVINIQTFTATGTYTPTANMKYCIIEVVGAGGGGGGCVASTNAAAGGGGGGGYSRLFASAATIGASKAVTIGAAGTAGANTGGTGGTGGTTSVGATLLQATGGAGGLGATATGPFIGGNPGLGSIGTVNSTGQCGGNGSNFATKASSGGGGASNFGGSIAGIQATISTAFAGANGSTYGGGGSGAVCTDSVTANIGGTGGAGYVVVTEYI